MKVMIFLVGLVMVSYSGLTIINNRQAYENAEQEVEALKKQLKDGYSGGFFSGLETAIVTQPMAEARVKKLQAELKENNIGYTFTPPFSEYELKILAIGAVGLICIVGSVAINTSKNKEN